MQADWECRGLNFRKEKKGLKGVTENDIAKATLETSLL